MIPLSQCISVRYDFHSALEYWIDYQCRDEVIRRTHKATECLKEAQWLIAWIRRKRFWNVNMERLEFIVECLEGELPTWYSLVVMTHAIAEDRRRIFRSIARRRTAMSHSVV